MVKWREAYNDTKAKFDLLESAKSREVLDSAEKMDRLTAEKRRMEERLKVRTTVWGGSCVCVCVILCFCVFMFVCTYM